MTSLGDDRYDAELRAQTARFAAAVKDSDPAMPVPTCPAWTLGELTAHVGFGHRWASSIVERRAAGPVPHDQVEDVEVPKRADEQSAWLVAGARRLTDAVRESGPGASVWSWAEDKTAGFWLRRITHETLVHRIDAELAVVGRAAAVPSDLAADSVSDLLDMFRVLPRIDDFPALAGLRGNGQTLHFHATDPDLGSAGEWVVRRTPSGVQWEHRHSPGDVVVSGPARDLMLVLGRRANLDDSGLEVSGDQGLLAHWVEHSRLEPA